jgi:hypothetical protein
MAVSLFPEEELPVAVGINPKERLMASYTTLLLNEPPVKSLMPENCPDETERRRRARNIASKDVPRNLRALKLSCLEVAESARMASAKHLLKSWLKALLDDAASGGNGSEDIDVDSLIKQTRDFLGNEFSI